MNRWAKLVLAFLGLAAASITPECFGAVPEQQPSDPHTEEALPSVDLKERPPAQPPRRLPIRERLNHSLRRLAEATTNGGVRHYAAARSCLAR